MSGQALHITVDGRKHAGTFTVDRKHLTVSTSCGKKTAAVDSRVRYKVLAHELLKQLVQEEKEPTGSTI